LAERLLRTSHRLDHVVILGERHLQKVLQSCAHYQIQIRTHLSLGKDAPSAVPRSRLAAFKPSYCLEDSIITTSGFDLR
jgi:hypothetical protein